MVCSLRGSVCIYQGEELGLPEADVPFESLRDPYGINFWPNFKGRDGCRTPMPWTPQAHGGFSRATPWLPVPAEHLNLAVSGQERDPDSRLNAFRRLMRWRKQHPALLWGGIEFLLAGDAVLAFTRQCAEERLLVAFNLSPHAVAADLPREFSGHPINGHGLPEGKLEGARLSIPSHGVLFSRL
jgi:alpha-glucosidase